MAYKILFEPGKCQGYANCLIEGALRVWDFDDAKNNGVTAEDREP